MLERHLDAGGPFVALHLAETAALLQVANDNNLAPTQRLFVRSRIGLLYRLAGKHERLAKVAPAEARLGQALEWDVYLRLGPAAKPRLDLGQRLGGVIESDQRETVARAE